MKDWAPGPSIQSYSQQKRGEIQEKPHPILKIYHHFSWIPIEWKKSWKQMESFFRGLSNYQEWIVSIFWGTCVLFIKIFVHFSFLMISGVLVQQTRPTCAPGSWRRSATACWHTGVLDRGARTGTGANSWVFAVQWVVTCGRGGAKQFDHVVMSRPRRSSLSNQFQNKTKTVQAIAIVWLCPGMPLIMYKNRVHHLPLSTLWSKLGISSEWLHGRLGWPDLHPPGGHHQNTSICLVKMKNLRCFRPKWWLFWPKPCRVPYHPQWGDPPTWPPSKTMKKMQRPKTQNKWQTL